MSRTYRRPQSTIAVVSSDSLTANTVSTTAPTEIKTQTTQNADGADEIKIFVNVTAAGASLTAIEVYAATSEDGTNYTNKVYALTANLSATGMESAGSLINPSPYTKLYAKAIGDTATVTIEAVPFHTADA